MDVTLATQIDTAVTRKGLEAQKQEGQNLLTLLASAAPAFTDPQVGQRIDVKV